MARYIVTGNYTASAMKGMVANPSDREAAVRALVEAAGGKLESFHLTTGESDFSVRVSVGNVADLIAGLMATGASEAVCNLKTVQAFTSDEFIEIQKKAGEVASSFKAP